MMTMLFVMAAPATVKLTVRMPIMEHKQAPLSAVLQ
jgi:hypothetical protein